MTSQNLFSKDRMDTQNSERPRLVKGYFRKRSHAEWRDEIHRSRFLLPNIVTVASMFCGYLAIMYATSGRISQAVSCIALAIVFDFADGNIARKLNACTKFGGEFDSFADLISFGIAPAIIVYHWGLKPVADEFGVLVTFIFALCAGCRLARFNIMDANLQTFTGLPSTLAGATVISAVYAFPVVHHSLLTATAISIFMIALALAMVSRLEFFSLKTFKLRGIRLRWRIALGLGIALLWYDPRAGFLTITTCYALTGPGIWAYNYYKARTVT